MTTGEKKGKVEKIQPDSRVVDLPTYTQVLSLYKDDMTITSTYIN